MKHKYIRDVFTDLEELKNYGIFFSGIDGEGEYKAWHDNNQLAVHCFYKDGEREGVYKEFYDDGQIMQKQIYKKGIPQ